MDTASRKPPIPNHIRELRERAGMSLAELSEMTGINLQMLSRLERGERALTDHSLTAIATALKVKKAFLLHEVEAASRTPAKGDLVEDDFEALMLRFWRPLSLDAKFHVVRLLSDWTADRVGAADVRAPAVVNE
jgi:transcriptional regulator with XRE-family HTH domain